MENSRHILYCDFCRMKGLFVAYLFDGKQFWCLVRSGDGSLWRANLQPANLRAVTSQKETCLDSFSTISIASDRRPESEVSRSGKLTEAPMHRRAGMRQHSSGNHNRQLQY
jgi:hypothetical protein